MPNYHARNTMKKTHVVLRMVKHTTFIENGCWLWEGSQDGKGYGQIRVTVGLKPEKVHRLAAHFFLGYDMDINPLLVLHKRICPNRNCWNPDHLYLGTHQENIWDALAMGTIINRK